jgi:hypothetical protein
MSKKTPTKKTEDEDTDAALRFSATVEFGWPFKENERRNRKPLEVLGIDTTDLTDNQIQQAIDERAAKLIEVASLTVTNVQLIKE